MTGKGLTIQKLANYMDKQKLKYGVDQANKRILAGFKLQSTSVQLVIQLDPERNALLFITPSITQVMEGPGVTKERVADVLAWLMHINYRLLLGNFEWDHRDGEIRYRLAVPTDEGDITFEQFRHCLRAVLGTVNDCYPKLQRLIWGSITLQDALGEEEVTI